MWGVNSGKDVYYRTGTYGGTVRLVPYLHSVTGDSHTIDSPGTGWEKVDGSLTWISSGAAGEVWGVGDGNKIYKRDEVTEENPTGKKWKQVEGSLTQVDVFDGKVWGVDKLDKIWNSRILGRWYLIVLMTALKIIS